MEAMDTRCSSDRPLTLIIVSGSPLALVIFGMPIWYLFIFARYGSALNEADYLRVYGFLYIRDQNEHRYWELVIMAWRALLFVILAHSHSLGSHLQQVMVIAVLSVSLWTHLIAKPFKGESKLNTMEAVSLSSSIFVFFLGLVFEDPKTWDVLRAATAIVLIIVLATIMACFVGSLVRELLKRIGGLLAEWGIEFSNSDPLKGKIILLVMSIPYGFGTQCREEDLQTPWKHPSLSRCICMESQKAIEEGTSAASIPSTVLPCRDATEGKWLCRRIRSQLLKQLARPALNKFLKIPVTNRRDLHLFFVLHWYVIEERDSEFLPFYYVQVFQSVTWHSPQYFPDGW